MADDIISEVASCSVFFMGRAYGGVVGALSFNVCVQLRPRLLGGFPKGWVEGGVVPKGSARWLEWTSYFR